MAIAHTILACLINSPHSGYEINKVFCESVGCFWQASQQQIYRELSKMEKRGWVEAEVIPQQGKPDKKLYYVTELGKQQLLDWLPQATEPSPIREDLLVKVLAGYLIPKEKLIEELLQRRQFHQEQLQIYKQKQAERINKLAELPKDQQYLYLTLLRGIRLQTEWIAWCDEIIEILNHDFQLEQQESG